MEQFLEWRHRLWLNFQMRMPSSAQPLLYNAKEILLTWTKPYLTIYQWQGQSQDGPLTVSYAGFEYAKPFLKSILFTEEPVEREIGRASIWQLDQLAAAVDTDLSYVIAGKRLVNKLPHQNALLLPFWTRLALDIRGDWAEVEQRFRRDARRNEIRKAQKYGYTYEVSYDKADFETFYQTMYLPTMYERHAVVDLLLTLEEAREYFQRGLLFRIMRDGKWVAGGVCYPEQKTLIFIMIGVLNSDKQLIKEGAVGAINYSRIQWAHQQGYESVDFWGSRPYLTGLFLYKRKWGVTVSVPPDRYERIWLKIRHDTPAVRQFLINNPFIILDENQALWGLIIIDNSSTVTPEMEETWHKQYDTPGLNGLRICSVSDLLNDNLSPFSK